MGPEGPHPHLTLPFFFKKYVFLAFFGVYGCFLVGILFCLSVHVVCFVFIVFLRFFLLSSCSQIMKNILKHGFVCYVIFNFYIVFLSF